jgi:hypothetical protein
MPSKDPLLIVRDLFSFVKYFPESLMNSGEIQASALASNSPVHLISNYLEE